MRDARKFTIAALTIDNNFPYDKLRYWEEVKAAMNNVECDLEILNANDVNVLSNEECAKFLMEVDTINTMIGRLVKQLTNKLPES